MIYKVWDLANPIFHRDMSLVNEERSLQDFSETIGPILAHFTVRALHYSYPFGVAS